MAIGNPISLTSNVATKTISVIATASQSIFTVAGGYRINELAVFRNGVRLVDGRDFTARDGSIVTLLSAASEGDALEFQVFDTFRVADAITPFDSAQTIAGDLSIVGVLSATQLGSVNFNLTSGIQTFHDVRVGGALTVAGTLTYEDTTNTNTIGIATFSGGMNISGVGATVTTLNVTGVSTFASNVSIADSIFHTGDTDTSIRFPAADTFTVETAGSERVRVDSSGRMLLGTTTEGEANADDLTIATSGHTGMTIRSGTANRGNIYFSDGTSGDAEYRGYVTYDHDGDKLTLGTANANRLLIDSSGNLTAVNTASGGQSVTLKVGASNASGANAGTIIINNGGTGDSALQFDYENSAARAKIYVYRSTQDLIFDTAGSERLRITSAGQLNLAGNMQFTAADPELEFNNGGPRFRVPAANTLSIHTGGGLGATTNEILRATSAGQVLVNTTAARSNFNDSSIETKIQIEAAGNNDSAALSIISNAGTTNSDKRSGLLVLGRTRGTSNGSNTVVVQDDQVGMIEFKGMDGTSFTTAASIKAQVDGSCGTDDMPGRLVFSTSADGSGVPTERLRIHSDGTLSLGTNSSASAKFNISHENEFGLYTSGPYNFQAKFESTDAEAAIVIEDSNSGTDYNRIGVITNDMTFITNNNERLRIDSSGRLLIGNTSSRSNAVVASKLQIEGTGAESGLSIIRNGSGNPAYLQIGSTGGSTVGSTTASPGNLDFSQIVFSGSDGSSMRPGAYITAQVNQSGAWSSGDCPTALKFATTADGASSPTERARIHSTGFLSMGGHLTSTAYHRINGISASGGDAILVVSGYQNPGGTSQDSMIVSASSDSASPNSATSILRVFRHAANQRSINAAGSINASGADYAEYMTKSGNFTLSKGDVCGINSEGKLTNVFADAISFVVKSTDPSYVGGDVWHETVGAEPGGYDDDRTEEEIAAAKVVYEEALESARQLVDRIAFSGQVPVNVTGANAGQYIVPVTTADGGITGEAKNESDLTLAEYMQSVGKVIAIDDRDGRAKIIVKIA